MHYLTIINEKYGSLDFQKENTNLIRVLFINDDIALMIMRINIADLRHSHYVFWGFFLLLCIDF